MRSPISNYEFYRRLADFAWSNLELVEPDERSDDMLGLVTALRKAARLDDDHGVTEAPDLVGQPLTARHLQSLRNASRMTRAQMADEFGLDKRDIGRWERGAPIPGELVPGLADAFGVSIPFFLGEY
jgi:DNA-binding XRE family transcriptional regulator